MKWVLNLLLLTSALSAVDPRVSELSSAVESGSADRVYELLRAGVDPNQASSPEALSPFHQAVFEQRTGIAKLFLNGGAKANSVDYLGRTPLVLAAQIHPPSSITECINLLDALLDHGADVAAQANAAMHEACRGRSLEVVKHLMKRGAKADFRCLESAVAKNHLALVQLLLAQGIDPKQRDKMGTTLFHTAVESYFTLGSKAEDNEPVWKLLLELGIPMDAVDDQKQTALHLAASRNKHLAAWLIKNGANINAQNAQGRTPLMMAVLDKDAYLSTHEERFIQAGAKLDIADKTGLTALDHALNAQRWESFLELMKASAAIPDKRGLIERIIAADAEKPLVDELALELSKSLLPKLSSADKGPAQQASLMIWAVRRSQPALIDRFLTAGVNLNAADAEGRTAAHWAALQADVNMQHHLRSKGADMLIPDKAGATPKALAEMKPTLSSGSHDNTAPSDLKPATADLWDAVAEGQLAEVIELTKEAKSLSQMRAGLHLVHLAAAKGHTAVLSALIKAAPSERQALTSDGLSLMQISIHAGKLTSVQWLIEHPGQLTKDESLREAAKHAFAFDGKCLLNSIWDAGWRPKTKEDRSRVMQKIIHQGDVALLNRMRKLGIAHDLANLEYITNHDPFGDPEASSFLAMGGASHSIEVVRIMKEITTEALEIDWRPHWIKAMAISAQNGDEEMLRWFIKEAGFDILMATGEGDTALHIAAQSHSQRNVDLLLKYGAKLTLKNKAGFTPLDIANARGSPIFKGFSP